MEQNPSKNKMKYYEFNFDATGVEGGYAYVVALHDGIEPTEDNLFDADPHMFLSTVDATNFANLEVIEIDKEKYDAIKDPKPKQPQPGDIVQYISSANARYKGANPPYSCGEVLGIKDGIMKVVFSQTDDEEYFGTEGVHKWRWPGEKEWRR